MAGEHARSWAALVMLGAFHGINPAMGWLFAVALGLQEQRRAAVLRALLPIALGHALAITAAILVPVLLGFTLPLSYIRWLVGAILVIMGLRFLVRHPHLRWAGMRVGLTDLAVWSFLVATVHGAGLMVAPIFLGMASSNHHAAAQSYLESGAPAAAFIATALHTASYLLVTATIALLVFEKFGLGLLRKVWFNLDLLWAAALVATGAATFVV